MKPLRGLKIVCNRIQSRHDAPSAAIGSEDDPATFVRISLHPLGLDLPCLSGCQMQRDHGQISASPPGDSFQNDSERYLAAESQKIVTTTPFLFRSATFIAASMFAPDDTPTSNPSSRASFTTICCASSVAISI